MTTAEERYLRAEGDHEAMVAAFDWLRAELAHAHWWTPQRDPDHANHVRREVTATIISAIGDLYDEGAR